MSITPRHCKISQYTVLSSHYQSDSAEGNLVPKPS